MYISHYNGALETFGLENIALQINNSVDTKIAKTVHNTLFHSQNIYGNTSL